MNGLSDIDIVTDDGLPGWRARMICDHDAGEPWGDLAPALFVERRGWARFAAEVYVPVDADRIVTAWWYFADATLFGRYLRQWHGTTAITQAADRDTTVLIFDTLDYRPYIGLTDPADLSGEQAEWQAWFDGEVYGIIVEHRPDGVVASTADADAEEMWVEADACWGFYGYAHATVSAMEMLRAAATVPPSALAGPIGGSVVS